MRILNFGLQLRFICLAIWWRKTYKNGIYTPFQIWDK